MTGKRVVFNPMLASQSSRRMAEPSMLSMPTDRGGGESDLMWGNSSEIANRPFGAPSISPPPPLILGLEGPNLTSHSPARPPCRQSVAAVCSTRRPAGHVLGEHLDRNQGLSRKIYALYQSVPGNSFSSESIKTYD